MDIEESKNILLDFLAKYAYQYNADKPFTLSSGEKSDEYFDCKLALGHPDALACIGNIYLPLLDINAKAIGGLTMGADPIAISISASSLNKLKWFTVRKEPKSYGQKKLIEGNVLPGENVVIVEDVITSGGSTMQAIKACREFGLNILQVIALVDRQVSSGLNNIKEFVGKDIPVSAIFSKDEIKKRWIELNGNKY